MIAQDGNAQVGIGGNGVGDVRELLGLRTVAASVIVGVFVVTFAVVGYATAPDGHPWTFVPAWLIVSAAAVALVRAPGDPLPWWWTLFIVVAGPVATVLVFAVLPDFEESLLAAWPLSATTALATYLCVRGRTWPAWLSLLSAIAVCVLWAQVRGLGVGYGLSASLINLAPLIMSTFFAFTIRPAARDIFMLRRAGTSAVAAEAAHTAALDERDRHLVRLDAQARPLLERLADATPLTDAERRECALVEARLRDSLRAPVLDAPGVVEAAWEARARGVEVLLLDDHGLDGAPEPVRERVVQAMIPALSAAREGTITIRILPPGRRALATVLRAAGDTVTRAEYNPEGELIAD